MPMKPKEIKRLQRKARRMRVRRISADLLLVDSVSNPYAHHIVSIIKQPDGSIRARCTCPWAQNGGFGCSHVMAALAHMAESKERAVSFWDSREDAERQRHRILRLAGNRDDGLWITTRPLRNAS